MLPPFSRVVTSNDCQRMGSQWTRHGLPCREPDWQAASRSCLVSCGAVDCTAGGDRGANSIAANSAGVVAIPANCALAESELLDRCTSGASGRSVERMTGGGGGTG